MIIDTVTQAGQYIVFVKGADIGRSFLCTYVPSVGESAVTSLANVFAAIRAYDIDYRDCDIIRL